MLIFEVMLYWEIICLSMFSYFDKKVENYINNSIGKNVILREMMLCLISSKGFLLNLLDSLNCYLLQSKLKNEIQ
jgi:hypothetical protein